MRHQPSLPLWFLLCEDTGKELRHGKIRERERKKGRGRGKEKVRRKGKRKGRRKGTTGKSTDEK